MASTLNISLPEPLKAYVEAQTDAGNYGTPSQFILELIQDDRDRRRRSLEEHLLSALQEKSSALAISDDDWAHGDVVKRMEEHLQNQG